MRRIKKVDMAFKMNKEKWGLHQRAEGATRQGNSAATPITQKAKGSPLKLNEALVMGESIAAKQFHDLGAGHNPVQAKKQNDPEPPDEDETTPESDPTKKAGAENLNDDNVDKLDTEVEA
jgi:hypothetical protein